MNNPPAFPTGQPGWLKGMTLRDYFAAKALQSLILSHGGQLLPRLDADYAYKFADAMLDERGKNN